MRRLIPKQGGEEWMQRLGEVAPIEELPDVLVNHRDKIQDSELMAMPMIFSNYHEVGIIDTPFFQFIFDTWPPLAKEKRRKWN